MKIRSILGLAVAALLGLPGLSFADTINGGPPASSPSGGIAGSTGTATDFDFFTFGGTGSASSLQYLHNFSVALTTNATAVNQAFLDGAGTGQFNMLQTPSIITTGGPAAPASVTFRTGAATDQSVPGGQVELATFTPLFSGTFSVTILDNNSNDNPTDNGALFKNASVALGEAGHVAPVAQSSSYTYQQNEFLTFTGLTATAGTQYQVYATGQVAGAQGDYPTIGGLLFDFAGPVTTSGPPGVPEPSSIVALCGLCVSGLVLAARHRYAKVA